MSSSGTRTLIRRMIRKYGQTVQHKKRVAIESDDGTVEYTYTVEEPKRGQFSQLTATDLIYDKLGYRRECDYIGTFLPDTDVNEGDQLYVDNNWIEVLSVLYRRTGGNLDYLEVLLRRKK